MGSGHLDGAATRRGSPCQPAHRQPACDRHPRHQSRPPPGIDGLHEPRVLAPCGLPPKVLRTTRLADLVNTMDPNLVAAVFGMRPEGAMIYLLDHLDDGPIAQRTR